MALFIVIFDFRKPGGDSHALEEYLASQGGVRASGSTWMIRSGFSPTELRDRLLEHIDDQDDILVVESTGKWTSANMSRTPGDVAEPGGGKH